MGRIRSFAPLIIGAFSFLLLAGISVYLWRVWPSLPEEIPSHYNFAGAIDGRSGPGSLLLFLGIGWLVWLLITAVARFPRLWNVNIQITAENRQAVYWTVRMCLSLMQFWHGLLFSYVIFQSVAEQNLSPLFLPLAVVAILGSCVWMCLRLRRLR